MPKGHGCLHWGNSVAVRAKHATQDHMLIHLRPWSSAMCPKTVASKGRSSGRLRQSNLDWFIFMRCDTSQLLVGVYWMIGRLFLLGISDKEYRMQIIFIYIWMFVESFLIILYFEPNLQIVFLLAIRKRGLGGVRKSDMDKVEALITTACGERMSEFERVWERTRKPSKTRRFSHWRLCHILENVL